MGLLVTKGRWMAAPPCSYIAAHTVASCAARCCTAALPAAELLSGTAANHRLWKIFVTSSWIESSVSLTRRRTAKQAS